MNKPLVALLLLLPILSIGAFAGGIYQYSTTVELGETAKYETSLILVNYTQDVFVFSIQGSPQNIAINSTAYGQGAIPMGCIQQDSTWGKDIRCSIPDSSEKTTITVNYEFDNKIEKKNEYFIYSDAITLSDPVGKFVMTVKLPEGYGLINKADAYNPEGALIGSDGRRSFLYWTREGTVRNYKFDVSVAYETVGLFDSSMIEMVLIVVISIVIVGVVFLKYNSSREKPIKIVLPVLKSDEKKIFEAVLKHEPGVKQRAVVDESGYSKAKVSKVLKNLQDRGLLKLERTGRTNKIFYDPKFKNKS